MLYPSQLEIMRQEPGYGSRIPLHNQPHDSRGEFVLPVPINLGSAELEALVPRLGDVSTRSHSKGTTKPKRQQQPLGHFGYLMPIDQ